MPKFAPFFLPQGVWPIPGEPLRFHVASRSRPGLRHLVDLEECGFNGACGCEDFQFRRLPKLREDRERKRGQRRHRCWHIRRAGEFYWELHARLLALRYYRPAAQVA